MNKSLAINYIIPWLRCENVKEESLTSMHRWRTMVILCLASILVIGIVHGDKVKIAGALAAGCTFVIFELVLVALTYAGRYVDKYKQDRNGD